MKMMSERYNKTKKATVLLLALFVVFAFFAQLALAATAPPRSMSYQGRILNANGVPVSDTSLDMVFKIYDGDDIGVDTCLWSNSSSTCATSTAISVTLTDGLFSEDLGDTTAGYQAITADIFGDNNDTYLEVTIEGEALDPLKKITAAPYALNADMLDGITSASFFQNAINNTITGTNDFTGSIFAGASPFAFDGATAGDSVETTFAFTDPTVDRTVTFQDASGTVALLGDVWTDAGSIIYTTTDGDDVAIGGTVANSAEFGFDVSAGTLYLGDGSTINPVLSFRDALGGAGSLTFNNDNWEFSGGNIVHSANLGYAASPLPSYALSSSSIIGASAGGGAGSYFAYEIYGSANNQSVENASINQIVIGVGGLAENSSTGETNALRGVYGRAANTSTAAGAIEGGIYGVYAEAENEGAGSTVPKAVGIYGSATHTSGTTTAGYGIIARAGGASSNYAGYFYDAAVHVDSGSTPSTANYATGAGDLYIYDQLEIDGSAATGQNLVDINSSILTSGKGLSVIRDNSGTDMSGSLGYFAMDDVGSNGNVLHVQNAGTGIGLYMTQLGDQIPLVVSALGTTDYIATFTNDGNADTNMGIKIQACLDTNPTTACNYLTFLDGDGTVLGAVEGDGAGGVTNASAGSDYAELFPGSYASFAQGDVVGLDATGNVVLASDSDDIIGAYSVAPNTLGNWFEGWRDAGTVVPVALLGQVPVNVNMEGGAVTAGDYITLSSVTGIAKKATGVGYVLGQALESTSTSGTIQVYIKPTWQAVGILADDGSATLVSDDMAIGSTGNANATTQGFDSYGLMLRGSGWDGLAAQDVSLGFTTHVTSASEYKLSIEDGSANELAFVNQDGDLAISGRLYPSDQGALQTDKYIYYDGSTGLGGDFMRTNASGWGSGSYDFAEMFPVSGEVSAGEVVVFANDDESVARSSGIAYDDKIAGIVSTQPGFLAGDNIAGHVPVALAGRVPTFVSGENGDIAIGDPLTTSSLPGYAMKATEAGPVVGYAMESFAGGTGSITVFVRPSYYDGQDVDISDNELSGLIPSSSLDLSGVVNLNAGNLVSVNSVSGLSDMWSIDATGAFRTGDRFVQEVETYAGETVETYAVTSRETTIQLSGTIELEEGRAHVYFDDYDESFADIVSLTAPYRVFLTAHNETGSLYALNRELDGFIIRDTEGTSFVDVDFLVIAYHKDYEPEEEVVEDNIAEQEEDEEEGVIEEVVEEPVDEEPIEETPVDDPVDEEPVDEEPMGEEPIEENPADEESEEDAPIEEEVIEEVVEEVIDEPAVEDSVEQAVEEVAAEIIEEEPTEEVAEAVIEEVIDEPAEESIPLE